jgi:hypothetical protein
MLLERRNSVFSRSERDLLDCRAEMWAEKERKTVLRS